MTQKQNIRALLIAGLAAVSLGGLLLHVRIHVPSASSQNLIPFFASLAGFVAVPVLFAIRKSRAYAYVLNGMLVIIGIITMAHFSLGHLSRPVTVRVILFGTLFGSIITLLSNFMMGKALFELEMFRAMDASVRQGRFLRYPNLGWWGVHLVALSAVYVLGAALWK